MALRARLASLAAVAAAAPPRPSCESGVRWHPNVQLHDMTGAGDMNSTANLSAAECAGLCCRAPRCMAFFHTTNASMWNNNCGPNRRGPHIVFLPHPIFVYMENPHTFLF